ncbi:Deacetoxyvindoline 4-hydroxylase [Platanthera guangdongensis]|uniref:Deacetoxyvindoline 4-hydroxylase n=1 Tax=Platanthera guangdongensis TaxID=2320717 RepID=A0ABR2N286_9ASPA
MSPSTGADAFVDEHLKGRRRDWKQRGSLRQKWLMRERDESTTEGGSACLDSGFFYVTDHGISLELMDEVFCESKKFFNLPLHEKMKLLRNEKQRGYTPTLDEFLDPQNQVITRKDITLAGKYPKMILLQKNPFLAQINGLQKSCRKPDIGGSAHASSAHVQSHTPSRLWCCSKRKAAPAPARPHLLPPPSRRFRHFLELAGKADIKGLLVFGFQRKVALSLTKIIARALDLDPDFFDKPEIFGEPIATLRLLHYEGKVSNPSMGIFGCGAHSDFGFITLLMTDDVMGLQICKDKDARPQIGEINKKGFVMGSPELWPEGTMELEAQLPRRSVLERRELPRSHKQDKEEDINFIMPRQDPRDPLNRLTRGILVNKS